MHLYRIKICLHLTHTLASLTWLPAVARCFAAVCFLMTILVTRRLILPSSQALLIRGIALYTLQPGSGHIAAVTECHEHPVKLSYSQLLLVRPLVAGLAGPLPAMLPGLQEVSRWVQELLPLCLLFLLVGV